MKPWSPERAYYRQDRNKGRVKEMTYVESEEEEKMEGDKPQKKEVEEVWSESGEGPDVANFGNGIAVAPVEWKYLGQEINLEFKAGFVACTQDVETGMIKPMVGWFLSQKPNLDGMTDMEKYDYQEGLEDGHCDIYNDWDNEYDDESGSEGGGGGGDDDGSDES